MSGNALGIGMPGDTNGMPHLKTRLRHIYRDHATAQIVKKLALDIRTVTNDIADVIIAVTRVLNGRQKNWRDYAKTSVMIASQKMTVNT
jgi:limonene-1,2-epoxide hydrolase